MAIGERSDAVLRMAIDERSDAVLRMAMGERSDAVLRTALPGHDDVDRRKLPPRATMAIGKRGGIDDRQAPHAVPGHGNRHRAVGCRPRAGADLPEPRAQDRGALSGGRTDPP